MEINWWEDENSNLYRPLMTFSSYQPTMAQSHPQPLPPDTPLLQTNLINPDLVTTRIFTPPTNPTPNSLMAEEDRHGNTDLKDRSLGPRGANSKFKPRGPRNKAKPPPVEVETESPNVIQSLALEIPDGFDIIEILTTYAHKNHCGVAVLSSSGSVKDVAIRNLVAPDGFISLPGSHQILSLYGVFFPTPCPPAVSRLTVFVAGELGEVLGGFTLGKLVASGQVKIVAATFSNTTLLSLPNNTPGDASAAVDDAPSSGCTQGPLNPQDYRVVAPQLPPPSFY